MSKKKAINVREVLRNYYDSTRRDDEHEPPWTHPFFEPVYSGAPLDEDHASVAKAIIEGKVVRTDWLGQPRVVDRDGWKVGTTTWIFLRRKLCTPQTYKGWTIINAAFAGVTYWTAYNAENRVGSSAMTDGAIGPSLDIAEIKAHIDDPDHMAQAELARMLRSMRIHLN